MSDCVIITLKNRAERAAEVAARAAEVAAALRRSDGVITADRIKDAVATIYAQLSHHLIDPNFFKQQELESIALRRIMDKAEGKTILDAEYLKYGFNGYGPRNFWVNNIAAILEAQRRLESFIKREKRTPNISDFVALGLEEFYDAERRKGRGIIDICDMLVGHDGLLAPSLRLYKEEKIGAVGQAGYGSLHVIPVL